MQIFFTSEDPIEAAHFLVSQDRIRAQKQLLEGVQLINNICIAHDFERPQTQEGVYYAYRSFPKVFQNWLEESSGNCIWFITYLREISNAIFRMNGAYSKARFPLGENGPDNLLCLLPFAMKFTELEMTEFPNYAKSSVKNLDFTNVKPTTEAYKQYLEIQWKHEDKLRAKKLKKTK